MCTIYIYMNIYNRVYIYYIIYMYIYTPFTTYYYIHGALSAVMLRSVHYIIVASHTKFEASAVVLRLI